MSALNHFELLTTHLKRAFVLTEDLVQNLSEDDLKKNLEGLPSNTIGEQLWCIVGARESYFKAIVKNGWSGFSCSLKNNTSKHEVLECLKKSKSDCFDFFEKNELNAGQTEHILNLLEHEIQHHGQLIRYVYGNKINFPKSWNERYTV